MNAKRYSRKSTSITVSVFYEQYQLKKYNFDPDYQRDDNVWEVSQKSFLIDSILKNFPMPPIFFEQKIDTSTGKTSYDVIDGKQRLTTIAAFINGEVPLPKTFGKDEYGYEVLNGKNFNQIKNLAKSDSIIADYIADFWSYTISVEYIERPDTKIVDNIFDRLNREGTRLNSAELRKARHYDSSLYSAITLFREDSIFKSILSKLNKNRLQDISFITEICLLVLQEKVIDGVEASIDQTFENYVDNVDEVAIANLNNNIRNVENLVDEFQLDYDKYSINGVSHLYAVFYLAFYMLKNEIPVDEQVKNNLSHFFVDLRGEQKNQYTQIYHKSMQSASKFKSSRKKRIKSLLDYLGFHYDDTIF